MKKFFGALVIALLAIGANAQTFEKGSSIVSAQLGVGGGFWVCTIFRKTVFHTCRYVVGLFYKGR